MKIALSHFRSKLYFDSAINFVRCAAIDQLFSAFGFRIIHNHHSQDGHEVLYCPSYRRISICSAALLLCRFSSIVSIQVLRKQRDDGIVCVLHGSTAPRPSNGKRTSSRGLILLAAMHSFPIMHAHETFHTQNLKSASSNDVRVTPVPSRTRTPRLSQPPGISAE